MADIVVELTSTTAPGKLFDSREALAAHYQTAWHKYNLKRRSAGLPALPEADFEARWAAAQAVKNEKKEAGTDHLKNKVNNKKPNFKKDQQNATTAASAEDASTKGGETGEEGAIFRSQVPAYDRIRKETAPVEPSSSSSSSSLTRYGAADTNEVDQESVIAPVVVLVEAEPSSTATATVPPQQQTRNDDEQDEEQQIEIDPCQSLFDRHVSATAEENADYLYRTYGFFIPDREFLTDLDGLLGYCQEKIQIGHVCLYCQKKFISGSACSQHMRSSNHTKLRYEAEIDLDEFDVFYDFEDANREFMQNQKRQSPRLIKETAVDAQEDDDDDEDWEDVPEENEGDESIDDGNAGWYDDYQSDMNIMGFDVTPLGELIFPDGRIIGHRALRKYYRQNLRPTAPRSAAVAAARLAAGERLYRGRVYNTTMISSATQNPGSIHHCGLPPSAGRGILVTSGADGTYTQLSVYRYMAAVRKQRQGHRRGQKLMERTTLPMNKMDKKHNRMMNGVSVAHAKR